MRGITLTRRAVPRLAATTALLSITVGAPLWAAEPGAVPHVDDRIRQSAADAALSMQFSGGSAEACRAWQRRFGDKLRSLLAPHDPPKEWKTIVERTVDAGDHRREELVLTADGHPPLPVYLLIPNERSDPRRPGVLAIHGHGPYGYDPVAGRDDLPGVAENIQQLHYDYGRQLVRRGYVVAAPCLTPFGRRLGDREAYRGKDPCAVTHVRLQLLGKLLIAENLRDCLWALELLAGHEAVDPERLGCVGLSYGGRMTMLTSALSPRVRVAVISGALNVMQERITLRYSCGAQVIPGLLRYGDIPEIGSLIAPRPCVWEVGSTDSLLDPKWVEVAHTRIHRAYAAFGAEDRLQIDRFEGGHRWNGRLAYPLLDKVLQPPR